MKRQQANEKNGGRNWGPTTAKKSEKKGQILGGGYGGFLDDCELLLIGTRKGDNEREEEKQFVSSEKELGFRQDVMTWRYLIGL